MPAVVMIEVDVRATAGAFAPIVALPFTPAFALAFALAFAFALALVPCPCLCPSPCPCPYPCLCPCLCPCPCPYPCSCRPRSHDCRRPRDRRCSSSPARALRRLDRYRGGHPGGQSITSADLRGYAGKNAADAFKKRGVGGGHLRFPYRRGRGCACCARCLGRRGAAVSRRFESRPGAHTCPRR